MNNKFLGLVLGLTVGLIGSTQKESAAVIFTGTITPIDGYACNSSHTCSGEGTSSFSFGQPANGSFSNNISFTGRNSYPMEGDIFNLGALTVTNGVTTLGTFPANSDSANNSIIYMNLHISGLDEVTETEVKYGDFLIAYNATTNFNPDVRSPANADYLYFPEYRNFGAFYILEGDSLDNTIASIDILALDPARLDPKGFVSTNVSGNGFFAALPAGTVSSTGFYTPDPIIDPTAAPEPLTIVGSLIGGTAALRMRKKLKDSAKLE
jgi:hypothetical protein